MNQHLTDDNYPERLDDADYAPRNYCNLPTFHMARYERDRMDADVIAAELFTKWGV